MVTYPHESANPPSDGDLNQYPQTICKQRPSSKLLTPRMKQVLHLASIGARLDNGVRGRSAYGGLVSCINALLRHGFLDRDYNITEAGRIALGGSHD